MLLGVPGRIGNKSTIIQNDQQQFQNNLESDMTNLGVILLLVYLDIIVTTFHSMLLKIVYSIYICINIFVHQYICKAMYQYNNRHIQSMSELVAHDAVKQFNVWLFIAIE
jgi:hypothetical protein